MFMRVSSERMQSFTLLAVALVVAVHHSELAAHREGGPHHRMLLQETEAAEALAASLKELVEEEIDQTLNHRIAETVRDQVAALEKREDASIDELREQVRTIRRDCNDEAARSAQEQRDRRKAALEMSDKVEMLEKHTDALQAQVDELKRLRANEHAERRRTQRTGGGEAAQIIIRNTRSTAAAQSAAGRGRRRAQAGRPCDGRSLPERVAAVGIACCAAHDGGSGNGHRRMQADCALPGSCPSEACAATFVQFYDDCGGELAGELDEYRPLYDSCLDMRQGSSSLAMQLGVECTEDGVAEDECIPECTAEIHGYLMLLNVDGGDLKYSCQLQNTLYSWIGGAVCRLLLSC
eukprot:COSAG06_NODE_7688_length_2412_cov_5.095115_4_plen_350_part_01